MALDIGDKIPDLTLPATGGRDIALRSFKGKALVVYFYPKDNTPGCTQEGQDFRDLYGKFRKAGVEIVGVSRDSVRSHENFATKFEFPFALLSDADEAACRAFDVIREKTLYGRKYMGVDRSTFLFDAKGVLRQVWRSVKVKNHAQAVLDAAAGL
ncbi:MAG: peroxiredoxin [Sinimarinibacterium flocculans]|uniref:thioredoxin-dependent peroxiredoxin n=1 Tax=Sinimarinibacterium flocculans TaxID=985250 RepID=A0A318EEF9_9GAMM|nr:peroxiredoxin [Sinimarinibacterium flocculans]PXV71193.1 peroxiredoxin Q/BCP [Sinimarinibacterium flocculans]